MKIKIQKKIINIIALLLAILIVCLVLTIANPFSVSAHSEHVGSSAQSMVTMETSTKTVLYQKNPHKKLPMASTTKILTAITVIENTPDLGKKVKVPPCAVGIEGSSIYLQNGEELSIRDLLYGLMLQSGNDCAVALAVITSGSVEKFSELMNKTALKFGAENSNFTNPHGLHDDKHYTTAYDLALISAYALENEIFSEISKTKKHTAPWEGRNYPRVINNKNKLLNQYDGADGVKTGFTKKAGRCFVGSATRNGMQVVSVVINCGPMFQETENLMTRAFNEYSMEQILYPGQEIGVISIEDAKNETMKYGVITQRFYPLKKGWIDNINYGWTLKENLTAPMNAGDYVGTLEVHLTVNGTVSTIMTENLVSLEDVHSKNIWDRLKDIID
ncbi:MAG: D-alanyl-D-alanine carboxypeptidase [Firmicutes bacterium]|nr:D-alanyl-D-alanine carboxypeptidase [Bacillota bacterium]